MQKKMSLFYAKLLAQQLAVDIYIAVSKKEGIK
jgi:hypothetical protein